MANTAVQFENIWKKYRLGEFGATTLREDLSSLIHKRKSHNSPRENFEDPNLDLSPHEKWVLKGLDLRISEGEILGVVGKNGAGKSTLLKLLSRITIPTRGTIRARGKIASLLEVGTGFHPELTGRENVYLNGAIMGMRRVETRQRLDDIVDFSGCSEYMDTPVKRFSSGMLVRLGFAVAAYLDCDIMVVDEVLAVGDIDFQRQCLNKLKSISDEQGKTIIFVSHNLASVRSICTTGALIENGRARHFRSITDALIAYSQASQEKIHHKEFSRNPNRPTITKIAVDEKKAACGTLVFTIEFESPTKFSPIPGVSIYDENLVPVFGANGRVKEINELQDRVKSGRILCELTSAPIHSGRYFASFWLGDHSHDFDSQQYALTFDFQSVSGLAVRPSNPHFGNVNVIPYWTIEKDHL